MNQPFMDRNKVTKLARIPLDLPNITKRKRFCSAHCEEMPQDKLPLHCRLHCHTVQGRKGIFERLSKQT